MESFYLILALVFSLIIAVLAIANNQPATVNYLFGKAEVSLIILILGSACGGALIIGLFSLFRGVRHALRWREARRRHEELSRQVAALEKEKTLLAAQVELLKKPKEEEAPPAAVTEQAEQETPEVDGSGGEAAASPGE